MVIPKLDLPDAIICRIDAWRTSSLLPASDPPDLCHEDPTERPKCVARVWHSTSVAAAAAAAARAAGADNFSFA